MTTVHEVIVHCQKQIKKEPPPDKLLHYLRRLSRLKITIDDLRETGVGKTVNQLSRLEGEVGQYAGKIVEEWKAMVETETKGSDKSDDDDSGSSSSSSSSEDSDSEHSDLAIDESYQPQASPPVTNNIVIVNNQPSFDQVEVKHEDPEEDEHLLEDEPSRNNIIVKSNGPNISSSSSGGSSSDEHHSSSDDDDNSDDDDQESNGSSPSHSSWDKSKVNGHHHHHHQHHDSVNKSARAHNPSGYPDEFGKQQHKHSVPNRSHQREPEFSKENVVKEEPMDEEARHRDKDQLKDQRSHHQQNEKHASSSSSRDKERKHRNRSKDRFKELKEDKSDKYIIKEEKIDRYVKEDKSERYMKEERSDKYRDLKDVKSDKLSKEDHRTERIKEDRMDRSKEDRLDRVKEERHDRIKEDRPDRIKEDRVDRVKEDKSDKVKEEKKHHHRREDSLRKDREDPLRKDREDSSRKDREDTSRKDREDSQRKDREKSDHRQHESKSKRDRDRKESKRQQEAEKPRKSDSRDSRPKESSQNGYESSSSNKRKKTDEATSPVKEKDVKKQKLMNKLKNEEIDSTSGVNFADVLGVLDKTPLTTAKKKLPAGSGSSPSSSSSYSTKTHKKNGAVESIISKPIKTERSSDKYHSSGSSSSSSKNKSKSSVPSYAPPVTTFTLTPPNPPVPLPLALDLEDNCRTRYEDSLLSVHDPSNEFDALSSMMSSRKDRTKVYSGHKTGYVGQVPSLFDMCIRIIQENLDDLGFTGGVPYEILKPALERSTVRQLQQIEYYNPYLEEHTDELWMFHCKRDCRGIAPMEMESWRELYFRCQEERQSKLQKLTSQMKKKTELATPVRKAKLAYVEPSSRGPRFSKSKTATIQNGMKTLKHREEKGVKTAGPSYSASAGGSKANPNMQIEEAAIVITAGSRASSAAAPSIPRESSSNSLASRRPRRAPLMQKTLKLMKSVCRR